MGFIFTPVNFDILSYLPENLDSVKGLNIIDEDFNEASMAIIILRDMTWDDMEAAADKIDELDNVRKVLWMGSVMNSPIPASMMPGELGSMLSSEDGSSTMMMVQFVAPGASNETLDTIAQMKKILTKQCLMSGTAAMTYDMSQMMNEEAPKYVAVALVLALIALAITMESFILPLVLLAALGISIVYNMGTNFIFGQISFVTQAIAAMLQLAVTMDYSVFLMDRYSEEKPKYRTREAAMAKAITGTFTSLAGSSLTTVFGFLALCFMQFTLGLDIGLVMAKGVILGILSVVIILPAILLLCETAIYKTKHRSFIPNFGKLGGVTLKLRKVLAIIFVILIIPAWYGQNNVKKYYNMMESMPDTMESIAAMNTLSEDFGMASMYMAVIDDNIPDTKKIALAKELNQLDGVTAVISLPAMLGTSISPSILPEELRSMLIANGKQMMMINSTYSAATDECNRQVENLNAILHKYDKSALLTGEAPMYKDLVEVTDHDFIVTSAISMIAIFVLIAIIFKSISVPFILVLSIELAIWINIAISFVTGEEISFITPTIISCVQLGATVDYAILLTTRYREEIRKGIDKITAMKTAAASSHRSIFQSALVFFAATFGVNLICDIDMVRSICAMLARGSVISALVIILFLTPLLVVCEGFINKTTYGWRIAKHPTEFTNPMLEKMQQSMEKSLKKAQKRAAKAKAVRNGPFKKAVPVPPELVAKKLSAEKSKEIEQAMIELAPVIAEKEDPFAGTEFEDREDEPNEE